MERESNNRLPFLDVLVSKNGSTLSTNVYRKPTHTGRYLHFDSNHPHHVKRGVVRSLIHRASVICQDRHDFLNEARHIKHDLALNGHPSALVNSIISTPTTSPPDIDLTTQGTVVIPYVKGVSEKFRRIGNRYNIRTIFKTSHTIRRAIMKTRPDRDLLETRHCIYSIPCECGRCYIGETGRPLGVRLKEHQYNLKQGLLDKSKLAQHAYEGHRVCWKEATVLQVESNIIWRKYKEAAHMAVATEPISQPSLEISPIWTTLINKEVSKFH
jgi:hypothetical protein